MEQQKIIHSKTTLLSRDELIYSQGFSKKIVNEIFENITDKMSEQRALEISKEIFKKYNIIRWHDIYVNFGSNTNMGYTGKDKKDPSIVYD